MSFTKTSKEVISVKIEIKMNYIQKEGYNKIKGVCKYCISNFWGWVGLEMLILLMTHSQIKWDIRLQNVKKIQINNFWALLYHIDRGTSFQDTKLTPK